jgi:uncharacterized membrane protein YqjE
MTAESVIHIVKRAGPAARAMLDGVGHRAQMALLELAEMRDKVASSLIFGLAALILSLLGGIALTFAIAALVWHREDRGLWLGLLTLAYFVSAGLLAWTMVRRLKQLEFLPETSRQLTEDRICLGALLHDEPTHPSPTPIP